MKLKRRSLIHTFQIKNNSIFLINNLQLVENINLFQKVENDIRRYIFEQHLERIYIKVFFSDINQIRTKKVINMFQWRA